MVITGYIILGFTIIRLLVALANLVFYQSLTKYNAINNELVSVLIPARNEESNIGNLLTDLTRQNYTNIEVIVFNDQSTDKTEQVLRQFTNRYPIIRYVNSKGLPDGWLGKNYACHQLSEVARGVYFLFLDADVRLGPNLINNTLNYLKRHRLGLLSIFPAQVMKSFGEKVTVPNMNVILLSLLPLILVRNSPFPSLAAANGQFMFFNAETYRNKRPHQAVKNNKVEDIEIAKLFKRKGIRVACLTGYPDITCRMYSGLRDAVDGFSRNVIMFFGNSFLPALLYWLITTFGFIVILFYFPAPLFLAYLAASILIRLIISIISRQPVLQNLVLAIPQQLTLGMFLFKALENKLKKTHIWKGRNTY